MSLLKYLLALSVLAAALTACCCPLGTLIGEAEFTIGDFADVPAYPGSTQTTESNTALDAMTRIFSFIAEESEWMHYTTTDSGSDVLDWYTDALPDSGWSVASEDELGVEVQGALIFSNDSDPAVMLAIFAMPDPESGNGTHILVGRIRIESEE